MSKTDLQIQNLGYPRIGERRELKRALESYWRGDSTKEDLQSAAKTLREKHWKIQQDTGVDFIPSNDFSFYDHVLDTSCLVGNIPERFGWNGKGNISEDIYFLMARGQHPGPEDSCCENHQPALACELTKWFDTNYHYLVPEFSKNTQFKLSSSKIFDEYLEAQKLGIETVPVLLGPLTYLRLGKCTEKALDRYDLVDQLIEVYKEILNRLTHLGVKQIRFDEPALSLDLDDRERSLILNIYHDFRREFKDLKIQVTSYFGRLEENLETLVDLPVDIIHLDLVADPESFEKAISLLESKKKAVSLGVVSGRNVWKSDLAAISDKVREAVKCLGKERVLLAPSCSLQHVPVSLTLETEIDPELKSWLAFANEKLKELALLKTSWLGRRLDHELLKENKDVIASRAVSTKCKNESVRNRVNTLQENMYQRNSLFKQRKQIQSERLNLPLFPTTTIGSFPQTKGIREARARLRKGEWSKREYTTFLKLKTSDCIKRQEDIGLDVLVHGEFERNDMVEYFGEQLEGFLFTRYGWVQSYGSRCVKPPVIYGDVSRSRPMTIDWAAYAQGQTEKPVKGMLTGPVTILQWSFVRDDQPRSETAKQIALAIRDEVTDLETAGLPIIQIDEAALREGLPLRRSEWSHYLHWAVRAFCLSSSGVADKTQIHTHMCYSEFNDILSAIVEMDADVITIESARSGDELLSGFAQRDYPNEIGPGVYDIHSPRVPDEEEISSVLTQWTSLFPAEKLWVNPDCGLKTRGWVEVEATLRKMVSVAEKFRVAIGQQAKNS